MNKRTPAHTAELIELISSFLLPRVDIHMQEEDKEQLALPVRKPCDAEYHYRDGLRFVKPYFFDFSTFTKTRWIGRTVMDVFTNDFKYHSKEYIVRMRMRVH